MTTKRLVVIIMTTLFFIPAVFSFGIASAKSNFEVFPNKTYSDEICVSQTYQNTTYYFYPQDSTIFEEFYVESSNLTAQEHNQELCNRFYFSVSPTKSIDENNHTYYIYISDYDAGNVSFFGMAHKIEISSIYLDYKDPLFNLSTKFIVVFLSVFSTLGLLLYIIRNKKFNE